MAAAHTLSFPDRPVWGPTTRQRLARASLVYLVLLAAALVAPSVTPSAGLQAAILGLAVPGGGFLLWAAGDPSSQVIHVGFAGLALAAFGGACVLWFATGNVLAPAAVWLLSAFAAGAMGAEHAHHGVWSPALRLVPLAGGAALGLGLSAAFLLDRRGLEHRRRLNASLAAPRVDFSRAMSTAPSAPELSLEDLQLMRVLLDRALQPIERFDGFEWLDQFQTAAVRYQINMVSYALSMAQFVHTPAFGGYMNEAQRRLAAKQQDHRVWGYWELENLWGNLRRDPDPVPRDNIMFTGFLAAQLALFHAASGERTFDQPGSLLFEHPGGRRFSYDLPALCRTLAEGFRTTPFGLIPCEPNWIYPLCNSIGAAGLNVQDNLSGTRLWTASRDRFLLALETEFVTTAGEFVPCRSAHLGLAMPQIGGAVGQAFPCFFLNAALPEVAQRHWAAVRERLSGPDLRRHLWRVDVGNYGFGRASSYAATAAAAVELGDGEIASRLLGALDEDHPRQLSDGVAHRPGASLWAHAAEVLARAGAANALHDMTAAPPRRTGGPRIALASYPEVLIARATESAGGLEAVLHPGRAAGPQTIGFTGLRPAAEYTLWAPGLCEALTADDRGSAEATIVLEGRTEVRLAPRAGPS